MFTKISTPHMCLLQMQLNREKKKFIDNPLVKRLNFMIFCMNLL